MEKMAYVMYTPLQYLSIHCNAKEFLNLIPSLLLDVNVLHPALANAYLSTWLSSYPDLCSFFIATVITFDYLFSVVCIY